MPQSTSVNSLWPGDAIWRHGTWSTFDRVMACCLMAQSHYLNQCWLIIGDVPWHSSLNDVKISINKTRLKIAVFKMASRSPRGQWVNDALTLGKWWLGAVRQQAITWANAYPAFCPYMGSIGHKELKCTCQLHIQNTVHSVNKGNPWPE